MDLFQINFVLSEIWLWFIKFFPNYHINITLF